MTLPLDDLLSGGFGHHDTESEQYAADLEAAAAGAVPSDKLVRFAHVANHTIGEHLGDWPRARNLVEGLLAERQPGPFDAPAWGRLATARFLSGDAIGAAAAEMAYMQAAGPAALQAYLDCKVNLASSLVGSGRTAEAAGIYVQAVALAPEEKSPLDRSLAVASNNLASDLVEKASRTADEDALMQAAADAAYRFWLKAGNWVNEERALYLKALVANALGRPQEALEYADHALVIIEENGEEPVDSCFLNLAQANAFGLLGQADAQRGALATADELTAAFDSDGLKNWYAEERAKIRLL